MASGWRLMPCGGSRAAIQEYILRSWSLVKLGTTAAQKKLFFNLRRVKGQIEALEEGDLKPDRSKTSPIGSMCRKKKSST